MNERILIVDDEPDILETLNTILTKEGFQVKSASGGEEAIEIFKSEPFELVITNIRMPGLDGFEVIRQLKKLDKDVEIIVLTALGTFDSAVQALRDDGAFDYLTKPLEKVDELIVAVGQALERRRLHRENRALLKALTEAKEKLEHSVEKLASEIAELKEQLRKEIIKRKQAEEALRETEERYRSLLNQK